MMEGPQVKIDLGKLRRALLNGDDVKVLCACGIVEMAERYQVDIVLALTQLLDDVVKKVREESIRFDPKIPYPNAASNNMSIQVTLPAKSKIGNHEYNTILAI